MAGGSGKRLWPLSRGNTPKQLLPVAKGKSLLRLSFERLLDDASRRADLRLYRRTAPRRDPRRPDGAAAGQPAGRTRAARYRQRRRLPRRHPGQGRPRRRLRGRHRRPRHQAGRRRSRPPQRRLRSLRDAPGPARHVRRRADPRSHRPRLRPAWPPLDVDGGRHLSRCRRSRRSPTSPPPIATSKVAGTTGTAACSSGVLRPSCEALGEFLPESHSGLTKIAEAWGTDEQAEGTSKRSTRRCRRSASTTPSWSRPADAQATTEGVAVVELPVTGSTSAAGPLWPKRWSRRARQCRRCTGDWHCSTADANIVLSRDDKTPDHLIALIGSQRHGRRPHRRQHDGLSQMRSPEGQGTRRRPAEGKVRHALRLRPRRETSGYRLRKASRRPGPVRRRRVARNPVGRSDCRKRRGCPSAGCRGGTTGRRRRPRRRPADQHGRHGRWQRKERPRLGISRS